jgi:hypothetical protein
MTLSFVDRIELDMLVKNAKLEQQETVAVSVAVLEALMATPVADSETSPLPLT